MNFVNKYDIDDEELEKLALEECKLIVDYFTPEEINKLELHLVNPEMAKSCVYGIMTGTCNNERVYDFTKTLDTVIEVDSNIDKELIIDYRSQYYMTPLEEFIYQDTLNKEFNYPGIEDEDRMPNTALIIAEIKRLQNENN